MKILNFTTREGEEIRLGIIINGFAVSFDVLQKTFLSNYPQLSDIQTYLDNHPESVPLVMACKILDIF